MFGYLLVQPLHHQIQVFKFQWYCETAKKKTSCYFSSLVVQICQRKIEVLSLSLSGGFLFGSPTFLSLLEDRVQNFQAVLLIYCFFCCCTSISISFLQFGSALFVYFICLQYTMTSKNAFIAMDSLLNPINCRGIRASQPVLANLRKEYQHCNIALLLS